LSTQAAEGDHSGVTYGGLPTGFIVAGANCVINSYWIVEHECRVVFWAKFYEALTNKVILKPSTQKPKFYEALTIKVILTPPHASKKPRF
jgi:hypothetical protein